MSRARRGVGRGQQRKASDARADRAAFLLWAALAALAAARIALSFTSGMWMWGLNLQRFLDPVIGWPTWLAATLTLIPALARRLEPGAASLGDALSRRRVLASAALTLLVAGFAWGSADNTRFVGDFLLRQGTVELNGRPAQLFPQALPLDVFLHYTLPSALQGAHLMSANESARLLGAIDAAALALVAMAFVRSLALTGAGGFAAWAVVVFGGYLGMFTGYGKSLAELVTLAAAIGAFGLRVARDGRGKVALGMTLALALALHRSAVVFLLPAAVAWGVALRREGVATLRTRQTWIALGVPLATLALLGARIVTTMMKFDTIHLAAHAGRRSVHSSRAGTVPRLGRFRRHRLRAVAGRGVADR
ncbi:MAG: hypothetical protein HYR73_06425 [Candidatus Eisenbacteria bacterium]|nr:hypothetical protein [Candidatus Eisenbacteria bacterium]